MNENYAQISRIVEISHGEYLDPRKVADEVGCTPNTAKKHLLELSRIGDNRVRQTDQNNGRNQYRTIFYVRTDEDIHEIHQRESDKRLIAEELGVRPSDVRFLHGGTQVEVNREALVNRLTEER